MKKKCLLVKSAKDTRSGADRVKAHSGEEMVRTAHVTFKVAPPNGPHNVQTQSAAQRVALQECLAFSNLEGMEGLRSKKVYRDAQVIGIDEVRLPKSGRSQRLKLLISMQVP